MKLAALKALVAAVEEGSLRRAARRLGLSQPALTKAIRELERELGAPLLSRSTTGVEATAQGRVLFERARAADRELMAAVDQIRQLGGAMVGDLNVSAVPLAVLMLIPEAVRTFSHEFPGIRLRLHEELYVEQLGRLRRGEVDLVVGPVPAAIPGGEMQVEPLMPISMVVVVRKGHPLAKARTLAELAEARWVFTGPTPDAGYARHLFMQHGLPPPPAAALVNSTLVLLSLIAGGDYVGLMPQPIAAHPLVTQFMVTVPIREGPLKATLAAMSLSEKALSPAVRHFIAHLGRAAHHLGSVDAMGAG
jgi:DNA-binding transcriptional LysR family regulator